MVCACELPCGLGNMWVEYMFGFENKISNEIFAGENKISNEILKLIFKKCFSF